MYPTVIVEHKGARKWRFHGPSAVRQSSQALLTKGVVRGHLNRRQIPQKIIGPSPAYLLSLSKGSIRVLGTVAIKRDDAALTLITDRRHHPFSLPLSTPMTALAHADLDLPIHHYQGIIGMEIQFMSRLARIIKHADAMEQPLSEISGSLLRKGTVMFLPLPGTYSADTFRTCWTLSYGTRIQVCCQVEHNTINPCITVPVRSMYGSLLVPRFLFEHSGCSVRLSMSCNCVPPTAQRDYPSFYS